MKDKKNKKHRKKKIKLYNQGLLPLYIPIPNPKTTKLHTKKVKPLNPYSLKEDIKKLYFKGDYWENKGDWEIMPNNKGLFKWQVKRYFNDK